MAQFEMPLVSAVIRFKSMMQSFYSGGRIITGTASIFHTIKIIKSDSLE